MKMHRAFFVGNDETVIYRSFFTPTIYYRLEAISLTPKKCNNINN